MTLRLLARCLWLAMGFALTSFGLVEWQAKDFALDDVWAFEGALQLHPIYILCAGIAIVPPALWEIFVLDHAPRDVGEEHED